MHDQSLQLMAKLIGKHAPPLKGRRVIDVGSYDRNAGGSYRSLVESRGGRYCGLDLEAGPNVDVVVPDAADWSGHVEPADVVISGQCIEHVRMPWVWIQAVASVATAGATLIIIGPWSWRIHRYPVDCWRVLPDGMDALFEWGGLQRITSGVKDVDCYGVARKT